ncbi:uncharacterized protein N7515_000234 [Penicillium bovifimosum]|uniref:Proteinase inhibitor, propeptide n=1 Tax=Penicillium bovifimosum TaxID=126998 RepID=A0A9W9HF09_9EURO|nr:uncharacterized protein N7515_000234 [Penicillium bovifimosum]KAJ5145670.1 hypothetical protein N7515_000234 [Penicillium bovifimosum]
MRFTFAVGLLALPLALAESFKSVVVTFPKGTPDSVVIQAKESLVASGGVITHEYHLINGFAADAPVSALNTLSTQDVKYSPTIEEDKIVNAYGDYEAAI